VLSRKIIRRRLVFVAISLTLVLSAVLWWPAIARHARLLYWQRQCLSHAVPADSVVLKIDDLKDVTSRSSSQWDAFYAAMSPPGKKTSPTVFVGSLAKQDGSPRIVALDLFEQTAALPNQRTFLIRTSVIAPGLLSEPKVVVQTNAAQLSARSVEVHAGHVRSTTQLPCVSFDAVLDGTRYTYEIAFTDDNEVAVDRSAAGSVTPPAP
jgi:hypothetical protein